jgi:hypothetical protein
MCRREDPNNVVRVPSSGRAHAGYETRDALRDAVHDTLSKLEAAAPDATRVQRASPFRD